MSVLRAKGAASQVWKWGGLILLVALGAFVFQYLFLFLLGVCIFIVCWFVYFVIGTRLKNDELNSMTAADKRAHYAQSLHFFTVEPRLPGVAPSAKTTPSLEHARRAASHGKTEEERVRRHASHGKPGANEEQVRESDLLQSTELADQLEDHCLQSSEPSPVYRFRDMVAYSGLPTHVPLEYDGIVTLHVPGSWSGIGVPRLNAAISSRLGYWSGYRGTLWRASERVLPMSHLGGPVISFQMPTDDIASLNFGQKDDAIVLTNAFEVVCLRFPKARIVLYAECLGGLRVMNWLGAYQGSLAQVAGVVLESPLPSVEQMLTLTKSPRINRLLYRMFCLLMPNFNADLDRNNRYVGRAIDNIPLLVGVLKTDWVSGPTHLPLWTQRIRFRGGGPGATKRTVIVDSDGASAKLRYGHLFRSDEFQAEVAKFYALIEENLSGQSSTVKTMSLDAPDAPDAPDAANTQLTASEA